MNNFEKKLKKVKIRNFQISNLKKWKFQNGGIFGGILKLWRNLKISAEFGDKFIPPKIPPFF